MRRTIGSMLLAAKRAAAPAHADTLVDNIKGETIAPDGTLSFAAFLFDDNGVIKTVYRPGDKLPKPGRKGYQFHIDGKDGCSCPGSSMRMAMSCKPATRC
jgi:hypothetical protein